MTQIKPATGLETEPSSDQLHQLACIVCRRSDGELLPAGHVATGTGEDRLTWAVAACPEHQAVAAC